MNILHSLSSEWLKTRRSAASWLCLAGGLFLPLLFLTGLLLKGIHLNSASGGNAWMGLAYRLWHFMGILLLPVGIVLAASLLLQIEYRSNGWKQLHTTPQSHARIFAAKGLALLLLTLKFFLFFNIGMLVAGILPTVVFSGRMPDDPFPLRGLLLLNAKFFLACLPVLTLQFGLSLLFRNFLVSVGIGLLLVIGALLLVEAWDGAWILPYSYSPMLVLFGKAIPSPVDMGWLAAGYSVLFTGVAYLLYRFRGAKG